MGRTWHVPRMVITEYRTAWGPRGSILNYNPRKINNKKFIRYLVLDLRPSNLLPDALASCSAPQRRDRFRSRYHRAWWSGRGWVRFDWPRSRFDQSVSLSLVWVKFQSSIVMSYISSAGFSPELTIVKVHIRHTNLVPEIEVKVRTENN